MTTKKMIENGRRIRWLLNILFISRYK